MNQKKLKKLINEPRLYFSDGHKNRKKRWLKSLNQFRPYFIKNLHHVDKLHEVNIPIASYYKLMHGIFNGMAYRKGADESIKKLIQLKPNAKNYYLFGLFLKKEKLWWRAVETFAKSIELSSKPNFKIYREYALALEEMNRFEDSAQAWEKSKKIQKLTSQQYYRYGYILEKCNRNDEAEKAYENAIKLDDINNSKDLGIGIFHEKRGYWDDAVIAYKKTTKVSPVNAEVYYKLGLANDRCYDWAKAEQAFQQAISLDTTKAYYFYRLGFVCERQKKWNDAAKYYQQALDRQENHTPYWFYRLGFVLEKQGQHEAANQAFLEQRVLQNAHGVLETAYRKNAELKRKVDYTEYYERYNLEEKTILYESYHGSSISCNPYAIFKSLLMDDRFKDYKHVWVINDRTKIPTNLKTNRRVIFIARDCDAYSRYLTKAKYLINNTTFPTWYIRKDKQVYLNTWHGTPIKTLGKDVTEDFMSHKNQTRNFLQASHIINPNPYTTSILKESYDFSETFTGVLATTGYPRQDLMLNVSQNEKKHLLELLKVNKNKKVVLYAPTWRGTVDGAIFDTSQLERDINKLQEISEIHLLFRGHYMVEEAISKLDLDITVAPSYVDTNSLLSVVDILITDYSSICFDFMALDKPIIYYTYDRFIYEKHRGLYLEIEELEGDICYTINELKSALLRSVNYDGKYKISESIKNKFCPYDDGKASERAIDLIFFNKTQMLNTEDTPQKESILIYGGPLMANGITTSFINLANHIDKEKYTVTIVIDPNAITLDNLRIEQLKKFDSTIKVIPRVGQLLMTLEERWILGRFNNLKNLTNTESWNILKSSHTREFKRVFGYGRFNHVVNFEGYTVFWSTLMGMKNDTTRSNAIYQHNDLHGEWTMKFPYLEQTFNTYHYYKNIVSVSKKTKEHNQKNLANLFSLDPTKFIYCDNLQNPEEIITKASENIEQSEHNKIFRNTNVFINIGRLSPEKGHEKLIRAFYEVSKKHSNIKLIILGSGPLEHHLINIIKELSLKNQVFLLGQKSNPYPYLKASDCFILPSDHEGQPMTLFEAMILKKPIIATNIVGNRSVLEGRPGFLVENNEEGLKNGMLGFIEGKYTNTHVFNHLEYNSNALDMFHKKITVS